MNPLKVIQIAYVPLGAFVALLGVPLWLRRVPPNRLYGVRVRKTLGDPAVWYDANAYAGRCLVGLGAVVSLSSLVLLLKPSPSPVADLSACGATLFVGAVLFGALCFRYVRNHPGGA